MLTNEQIIQVLTERSKEYSWSFRVYEGETGKLFWAIEPFSGTFAPITVGFDNVADYDELESHIQNALRSTADYINPVALPIIPNLDDLNAVGIGQEDKMPGEYI